MVESVDWWMDEWMDVEGVKYWGGIITWFLVYLIKGRDLISFYGWKRGQMNGWNDGCEG